MAPAPRRSNPRAPVQTPGTFPTLPTERHPMTTSFRSGINPWDNPSRVNINADLTTIRHPKPKDK